MGGGEGLFGPDGFAGGGVSGAPAVGELGDEEEAASSFVVGVGASHVGGGVAGVGDFGGEGGLLVDGAELDGGLAVAGGVGEEFADGELGGVGGVVEVPGGELVGGVLAGLGDDGGVGGRFQVATWSVCRAWVRAMRRAVSSSGWWVSMVVRILSRRVSRVGAGRARVVNMVSRASSMSWSRVARWPLV